MTQHVSTCFALTLLVATSTSAELPGWEGLRVMLQEGRPVALQSGDLDGDGRDELIVVNTQNSRLDLYHWLPPEERLDPDAPDKDRPNDLPMPPDFRRTEIPLEHLPRAVELVDLDEDGAMELVVLVSTPNKVIVYGQDDASKWTARKTYDLMDGEYAPRHRPLLLRRSPEQLELLIGMGNGIQRLAIDDGARPTWLTPREQQGRVDWWLADVDDDGDVDVVEQLQESNQSIRWFQCASSGHLMPGQALYDRAVQDAEVLRTPAGADQILLLDGKSRGVLRRYDLVLGEASALGRRRPLALKGGQKAVWRGLRCGGSDTLVAADRERPQLLMYRLEPDGWGLQQTFPAMKDIQEIAAPQAEPGTLLLWAEGAADLFVSRWENGRMTFPKPWQPVAGLKDHKIVALGSVGPTTWWLQQVGSDSDLYVWPATSSEPERTRFEGINLRKGGQVRWLGGHRLLVRRDYRDAPKLVHLDGESITTTSPAHLSQINMDDLDLVDVNGEVRIVRRGDGVLQWLTTDLQPVDQIMLPQGRELADYVALDERRGWALEDDGQFLHLLEADEAGIVQVQDSVRIHGGVGLRSDPVLGLILVDTSRVISVTEGRPVELKMIDSIDGRIHRRSGVREAKIHRISALDIDGIPGDEVLLMDDRGHQLSALTSDEGKLTARISWPVFEDKTYPYSDDSAAPTVTEPRAIIALDVDGDDHKDLAMACHDRIIFYLARDES